MVLTAIASRNSGRPAAGVYLWYFTSRHARTAASTMFAGVGKSGSPAPKPITFSPLAFSALALASTARVADSAMAARRADVRFTGGTPDRMLRLGCCGHEPTCGHIAGPSDIFTPCGWPPPGRRRDWSSDDRPDSDGDPPLDVAERRTLRLRSFEDQARAGAGVGKGQRQRTGQLASTGSREEPRRGRARRPRRTVLAARWMGDRVGQRRLDGLLGCRHVRADRPMQPALRVR